MKCPRCGNELRQSTKDPNYGLCDNCRKKYKWLEETVPQKKNKNNTNIFILILIISIFMLAFSIPIHEIGGTIIGLFFFIVSIFGIISAKKQNNSEIPILHTGKSYKSETTKHVATSQPKSNLKYEHNSFKFWFYSSYTKKSTGERWISKYEYKSIGIYRPDPSFKEIFPYDAVDIVQEPENPFDNRAIAVKFHDNTLGYLYKGQHQDMANDFISRGDEVKAQVEKIDNDKIYLRLFFCKRRHEVLEPVKPFVVKLTGNGNEEMQGNIDVCSVGDILSVEMDYEKEKYLVCRETLDLGYIPKSKQEYMEQLEREKYEFTGKIVSISENDSEKYIVKVEIQPE